MLKQHIASITVALCGLTLGAFTPRAEARIISYAPVTSNFSRPAVQQRDDRFYLLLESTEPINVTGGQYLRPVTGERGRVVLHDRYGIEPPREIFVRDHPVDQVEAVAMNVTDDGVRHVLISANAVGGEASPRKLFYSTDLGDEWQIIDFPNNDVFIHRYDAPDTGGPVVRGRGSQIRLGTAETPFAFAVRRASTQADTSIYALDSDGALRRLIKIAPPGHESMIIGTNLEGDQLLIRGRPFEGPVWHGYGVWSLGLNASLQPVVTGLAPSGFIDGWLRSDGAAYLQEVIHGNPFVSVSGQRISLGNKGEQDSVLTAELQNVSGRLIFAVPTSDYEGAWIVDRRGPGSPTLLMKHESGVGLTTQWSDITGPEVEAVHSANSGERLLIQVHRPRAADNRIIVDPALAIWEIGEPTPTEYDELFLDEGPMKGFVSLDVDEVAKGGEFVFDSARTVFVPGGGGNFSGGGGGGQDIIQEWGVVRASLQQKLVLPAVARLPGAYDSFWMTDVIFSNPNDEPAVVTLEYVATGTDSSGIEKILTLDARELRLVEDALKQLFGIDTGGGALFITPELGMSVNVTSRTYSTGDDGTFGMGVGAIDLMTASSPRFPLSFAAALQGEDSRTNLLVTDAGHYGTKVRVSASGFGGPQGDRLEIDVPEHGQIQINGLHTALGGVHDAAASYETLSGFSIPTLVTIDNTTNDPSLFAPDRAAGVPRMIPMVGHVEGANGSSFRTDLYLYNPSDRVDSLLLQAKPIDREQSVVSYSFTLLPREARVIPDVYKILFGFEGLGKLIFSSGDSRNDGVRVTARTYNLDPDGGTYGFTMPALNAFQSVGPGETLEILGAVIDDRYRTNLAIVDSVNWGAGTSQVVIEVFADGGELLDSFEIAVRNGQGAHLTDLFSARDIQSDQPMPVIIHVTPVSGVFAAFATLVDNRTNDPVYLEPGLLAQP